VDSSRPRILAGTALSESSKMTFALVARSTTCAFVTIVPSSSMTKPVPEPSLVRTWTTPLATAA
jgi:hypothetical protein